jgi:hypothetical protein
MAVCDACVSGQARCWRAIKSSLSAVLTCRVPRLSKSWKESQRQPPRSPLLDAHTASPPTCMLPLSLFPTHSLTLTQFNTHTHAHTHTHRCACGLGAMFGCPRDRETQCSRCLLGVLVPACHALISFVLVRARRLGVFACLSTPPSLRGWRAVCPCVRAQCVCVCSVCVCVCVCVCVFARAWILESGCCAERHCDTCPRS